MKPRNGLFLELAGLLLQALGAAVLALVVAPDAVVGLVQRAHDVGSRIGQGEALAAPSMGGRKPERRDAGDRIVHDRHQRHRVDLARDLEQHPVVIRLPAGLAEGRPGGVARRQLQRLGVRRLVGEPVLDRLGEGELRQRPAQQRLQRPAQRRAVEALGLRRMLAHRPSLHELPLDLEDRRKVDPRLARRAQFGLDAEQHADEILQHRGQRDQQFRLSVALHLSWRQPRRFQPLPQGAVALTEIAQEALVEPRQALTVVKVVEAEIEAEGEAGGHKASMDGETTLHMGAWRERRSCGAPRPGRRGLARLCGRHGCSARQNKSTARALVKPCRAPVFRRRHCRFSLRPRLEPLTPRAWQSGRSHPPTMLIPESRAADPSGMLLATARWKQMPNFGCPTSSRLSRPLEAPWTAARGASGRYLHR